MPKSHKSMVNKNISFKKIESSPKNIVLFDACATTSNSKQSFNVRTTNNINKTVVNRLTPNTMKDHMPLCTENPVNCKSTISQSLL